MLCTLPKFLLWNYTILVVVQKFTPSLAFVPFLHYPQQQQALLRKNTGVNEYVAHPSPSVLLAASKDNIPPNILAEIDDDDEEEEDDTEWLNAELVDDAEFYEEDSVNDWISDREKATRRKKQKSAAAYPSQTLESDNFVSAQRAKRKKGTNSGNQATSNNAKPSKFDEGEEAPQQETNKKVYTPEEESIIQAMGGKDKSGPSSGSSKHRSSKREPGFLGDCTLTEITMDYGVPICYIADVLCMWGVPVPINPSDLLGDLVTGEQAFAMLEAINSLDVASLHDRYSNMNLINMCDWYDIDIKDAFEMAMKEGWNLPFGVQTCLRMEQEDELVRLFGDEGS